MKNRTFKRVVTLLVSITLFVGTGFLGYQIFHSLFVEAQVPLPPPTSPPLSCTGCHDFQASLFTNFLDHHPNAVASQTQTDMVTKVKAIRQDCCACHNYLINHTRGIVMLKDPDPGDAYPYNGDPVQTNNFCLSCHDLPTDSTNPPIWFSVNGIVSPGRIIAPLWSLPCGHAVNRRRNLRCLDCHKYHGSNFKSMLQLEQPRLCYMNGCHPEKADEFNPLNPSHHHVEGVLLGGVPTNVIACCDCHNPHHDTTMENKHPVSDPYSKADLYPVAPEPQVTLPVFNTTVGLTGFLISGVPFYAGNVNAAGTPAVDLFCMECHAPDIFIPPNPPWPGAPNISYELMNDEYDSLLTASNFFYPHQHVTAGACGGCHITKVGTKPYRILNGHSTHLKNASCTYCHDPHATFGTFVGSTVTGIVGVQRGHLLKDWLLADAAVVGPLPGGGGYQSPGTPAAATTVLASVNGASSCSINDPLGGCHDITHEHNSQIRDTITCNTTPCHLPFTPLLLRKGEEGEIKKDTVAPEPPK
ncbi:MAG: cytochrome c3 family protein [bacterium]